MFSHEKKGNLGKKNECIVSSLRGGGNGMMNGGMGMGMGMPGGFGGGSSRQGQYFQVTFNVYIFLVR